MKKVSMYIAHPISGLSYEELMSYYETRRKTLEEYGFDVFWPMMAKGMVRPDIKYKAVGYDGIPQATNHAICERDRWMVKMCDMLYLDLTGTTAVSIGCMMELAWAHDKGSHTIVVMEKDNIHRHAFTLECADIVFETEIEALKYLRYVGSREAGE